MGLKRRQFLQRVSLALGAVGINEAGWWRLQSRYSEALAQTTGGKLAFLVGINEYPDVSLSGCVTDVEMQKELLIHRFGFLPANILTLTNKQATKENIQTAFINHLTNQAKPDDLVLFHFSGYGSRVNQIIDENKNNELSSSNLIFQNTLVPIDGIAYNNDDGKINYILEETLWLLLRSLPTKKVVIVLDTSYVYPGRNLEGILRIRSRPSLTREQINIKEKAIQMQMRNQQNLLGKEEIYEGQLKGVILNASKESQFATETDWNGFSSGLFTYALTQNLWSTTSATRLQINFSRAASFVEQVTGFNQQPEVKEVKQQKIAQSPKVATITPIAMSYQNLLNSLLLPARGVITSVENNGQTANLWLGGLPISILDTVRYDSLFNILPNSDLDLNCQLQIKSRNGLTAKASVNIETNNSQQLSDQSGKKNNNQTQNSSPVLTGALVREKIRILPQLTDLMIALDPNMSRIERVDATSAFSAIPQVTIVANIEAADYIFSRITKTTITESFSAPLASIYEGRYALFSLSQVLIPNTIAEGGEAVKIAVQRLSHRLKTLLAAKILRLTHNEGATQMKLRANLATATSTGKIIMHQETFGVSDGRKSQTNIEEYIENFKVASESRTLTIGSKIQCELYNDSDRLVYVMLFIIESNGHILVTNPNISNQFENNAQLSQKELVIAPGDSINISPVIKKSSRKRTFEWRVTAPQGLAESIIICSHQPFKETIAILNREVFQIRNDQLIKKILSPLVVAQATLRDLQNASQSVIQSYGLSTEGYTLDIDSWATLRFVYQVV